MTMLNRATIEQLCRTHEIHPQRERGQNFLIDRSALEMVVRAAELQSTDTVLEVGPGFGVLTRELASRVQRVLAVELDAKLVSLLSKTMKEYTNIEIVQNDIFRWAEESMKQRINEAKKQYTKIVANLPYQITGKFFRFFLEREPLPELIVVMIQKEVAERIVASPGQMSMLSVMVQYYGKPEIVAVVPRTAFWPVPEVDSAVVRWGPHLNLLLQGKGDRPLSFEEREGVRSDTDKNFFRLAKIGFSSKRKQLQHNFAAGLRIPREEVLKRLAFVGLAPTVRAQELSVDDWKKLVQIF